ncbi:hypothetical protein NEF87_000500 [Candidatus Lokiarchaeum ossiferum]|uniref:TIR domain-containing protein n=1 Tax=Candidatus Lokiarchaeum ossiferum TaxID=2951803 RepID=A0ABY6HL17_9ARCH|nr:hypothetical protein NEF87_000500 [Candidatus Lokiarchaeum sp. B-35]
MTSCIRCKGTGKCKFCLGTGKKGRLDCMHCNGTGKCNFCGGIIGNNSQGSFNIPQENFGGRQQSASPFETAKSIVGMAIDKLYSNNPMDRRDGIKMLNSHDAFHERSAALGPAIQIYPNETDLEVKRGLLQVISFGCVRSKDSNAYAILSSALNDEDMIVQFTAIQGLVNFGEQGAIALPKIRELYSNPSTPSAIKRSLMRSISEMGTVAEPVYSIITGELASTSYLMRKATKNAVKRLRKKGVNMVGYLIKQLEVGDSDQKISACEGLGSMAKDAAASASSLGELLNDESPGVRAKAAWALYKLEKKAAPAEKALKQALNDESSAVQKYSLKCLKKLKKLTKELKEEIKMLESLDKEMKLWRNKFISIYPEPSTKDQEENNTSGTNEQQIKNVFFMSHALPDFPWVKKCMDVIESWPGCRVWTCERDIPVGGDWLESIYNGLEICSWYLLFWSDHAEKSKWTNEEIREAKTRQVANEKPHISVINLGKEDWPILLSRYQGTVMKSDEDVATYLANLKTQVEF